MADTRRKRSRLETMNVILRLARKGRKKTHIMYQANLSHSQLHKYLGILQEKALLKETAGGFFTTRKGVEFIKKFQEIQTLMSEAADGADTSIQP